MSRNKDKCYIKASQNKVCLVPISYKHNYQLTSNIATL
jgi:hypothetical protein